MIQDFPSQVILSLNAGKKYFEDFKGALSVEQSKLSTEIDELLGTLSDLTIEQLPEICNCSPSITEKIRALVENNNEFLCSLAIFDSLIIMIQSVLDVWEDVELLNVELDSYKFEWQQQMAVPQLFAVNLTPGKVIQIPRSMCAKENELNDFMTESGIQLVLRAKIFEKLLESLGSNTGENTLFILPGTFDFTFDSSSALRICFAAKNGSLHKNIESAYMPQIPKIETWLGNNIKDIQQFENLVCLLSESNAVSSPLDKFIKKYQVLEDILFRRGLIDVMEAIHPHPFSLRSWKQVAEKTESNELPVLQGCMKYLFGNQNKNSSETWGYIDSEWDNFYNRHKNDQLIKNDIERVMQLVVGGEHFIFAVGIFQKPAKEAANLFAKALYSFRNSIVHHKPTEYALSSETTSKGVHLIMDEFWLPTLDHISYFCISSHAAKFKYPKRNIDLW